jgi:hypothetical protein
MFFFVNVVTHGMNMRVYFKVDLNFSCLELKLTFNLLKRDVIKHGIDIRVHLKVGLKFSCLELKLIFNLEKKLSSISMLQVSLWGDF